MVNEYEILTNIQEHISRQNHQLKKIFPPIFFCYGTNITNKFVLNPITEKNSDYHVINICSNDTYKYVNFIEVDELYYTCNSMEEAEEIVEYIINNPKDYLLNDSNNTLNKDDIIFDDDLIYRL